MKVHYPVSVKKLSTAWGHWGNKTACGLTVEKSTGESTRMEKMLNCPVCLDFVISKHEKALSLLKMQRELVPI